MHLYTGTSGWSYDAWVGDFYPEDLPSNQRLAYYARFFAAVEINNSFYHLPPRTRVDTWQESVPEDFTFAVKASRYITHNKKLKEAERTVENFMESFRRQPKVGPIIFQLPPHWEKNAERLEEFLQALPKKQRFAIEFRDPSWHDEDIYRLLKKYKVAFCLFEKAELWSPRIVTADFIYIRLHGRKKGYRGRYSNADLSEWYGWLEEQQKDAYVFFDNTDEKIHAIENALTFKQMAE